MIILDKKYKVSELYEINSFANGFVKGVVDLDNELVALDSDIMAKATEVICKWIQF